jgi:hypothetical protein
MANLEAYEDRHAMHEVETTGAAAASGANYSHFNHFKEIVGVREDGRRNSSAHRQARLDALPAARTAADIAARLSDTADAQYPIYRTMTLTTMVLDGVNGSLDVWCCGNSAASAPPLYRWNLRHFFE